MGQGCQQHDDGPDEELEPLIAQAQQGDAAAAGRLLAWLQHRFAGYFNRVLRRRGVPAQDVPDAIQEIYLTTMQAIHRWRGTSPASCICYVQRIVSTVARKPLRQARRESLTPTTLELSDRDVDPETYLVAVELFTKVLNELKNDKQKQALILQAQGYTVGEIAQLLGLTAKRAEKLLGAGRQAVQGYSALLSVVVVPQIEPSRTAVGQPVEVWCEILNPNQRDLTELCVRLRIGQCELGQQMVTVSAHSHVQARGFAPWTRQPGMLRATVTLAYAGQEIQRPVVMRG